MLSIILMILKIIGIVLAVVLGILLLLIAEILWVPVRYRLSVSKYEEIKAGVKLSWLLRFMYVTIRYEESKLRFVIRLAGIPIYDSNRPKKEKKKKKKRKSNKSKQEKVKTKEKKTDPISKESLQEKKDEQKLIKKKSDVGQNPVTEKETSYESKQPKETKHGMKYKLGQIIDSIKSIPKKISKFWERCRRLIENLKEKVPKAQEKIIKILSYPKNIREFLNDEINKTAFGAVFQTMRKILKYTGPKKVKGKIRFGFDDPCTTGQVLGGISVAYSYFNIRHIQLIPEFEQAVLEGEADVRGRIYSFTVMRIVLHLIRDKNFKTLRNRIKNFKEG